MVRKYEKDGIRDFEGCRLKFRKVLFYIYDLSKSIEV